MENASKALIIAGSILIAIIIISLGIVVFKNMSGSVKRNADLTEQQIASFNSEITPYLGESVSGSQVNTFMQLVRTINQKADNEHNTVKKIKVNNSYNVTRYDTGKFYTVRGEAENGLFTKITITENEEL